MTFPRNLRAYHTDTMQDVQEIRNAAKKGLGGDLGGAKEGFAKNLQNPLGKLVRIYPPLYLARLS